MFAAAFRQECSSTFRSHCVLIRRRYFISFLPPTSWRHSPIPNPPPGDAPSRGKVYITIYCIYLLYVCVYICYEIFAGKIWIISVSGCCLRAIIVLLALKRATRPLDSITATFTGLFSNSESRSIIVKVYWCFLLFLWISNNLVYYIMKIIK